MPDPIPRNRSAQGRRSRRLAMRWRRRPIQRTHDTVREAEPPAPQQCTTVGPPVYLDQPLRRIRETTQGVLPSPPVAAPPALLLPVPPPPAPVPSVPPPPSLPVPVSRPTLPPLPVTPPSLPPVSEPRPPARPVARPDRSLQRNPHNTEPAQPFPSQPHPPTKPATRQDQPRRRAQSNTGPPRPPRPRRASTDALVGGSLLAGVALTMGLVLPLFPLRASSGATAAPPVSGSGGISATAPNGPTPNGPNLGPVGDPPATQPRTVEEVIHGPTRDGVTLLADRRTAQPNTPLAANPPGPQQRPAPAQPAGAADPERRVDPGAVGQNEQRPGPDRPDSNQHHPAPVPPSQPSTHPDPPARPTREQLEQLAKQLERIRQYSSGNPQTPSDRNQGASNGAGGTQTGVTSSGASKRGNSLSGSRTASRGLSSPNTHVSGKRTSSTGGRGVNSSGGGSRFSN
jgi:hypothetical protein